MSNISGIITIEIDSKNISKEQYEQFRIKIEEIINHCEIMVDNSLKDIGIDNETNFPIYLDSLCCELDN